MQEYVFPNVRHLCTPSKFLPSPLLLIMFSFRSIHVFIQIHSSTEEILKISTVKGKLIQNVWEPAKMKARVIQQFLWFLCFSGNLLLHSKDSGLGARLFFL